MWGGEDEMPPEMYENEQPIAGVENQFKELIMKLKRALYEAIVAPDGADDNDNIQDAKREQIYEEKLREVYKYVLNNGSLPTFQPNAVVVENENIDIPDIVQQIKDVYLAKNAECTNVAERAICNTQYNRYLEQSLITYPTNNIYSAD